MADLGAVTLLTSAAAGDDGRYAQLGRGAARRFDFDEEIIHDLVGLPELLTMGLLKFLDGVCVGGLVNLKRDVVVRGELVGQLQGFGEMVEGVEEDEGNDVVAIVLIKADLAYHIGNHTASEAKGGRLEQIWQREDGPLEDFLRGKLG